MSTPKNYLQPSAGLTGWIFTLDHKRIAVVYLVAVAFSFIVGGAFALGLRTELFSPGELLMSADHYRRLFSAHGAVMVFLVAMPAIPAVLGNFALPLLLGARNLKSPLLNLLALYLHLAGAALFLASLALGGPAASGWLNPGVDMDAPGGVAGGARVLPLYALALLTASAWCTAVNIILTVAFSRARGLSFFRLPLFAWALFAAAHLQLVAAPVLLFCLGSLCCDALAGLPPGGRTGIGRGALQYGLWFYAHAAIYLILIPALGVVSEILATFAARRVSGYRAIVASCLALAALSLVGWGEPLLARGPNLTAAVFFSMFAMLPAVPILLVVRNWVSTLAGGRLDLRTPMRYALSCLLLLALGACGQLALGAPAVNLQLADSSFHTAQLHLLIVGGSLLGFLGGLFYFWPKMFGRGYSEPAAQGAWLLVLLGFLATFLPQAWAGTQGLAAHQGVYPEVYQTCQWVSSLGAYAMAAGFLLTGAVLLAGLATGTQAADNPWGSATLEGQTTSPPPRDNFVGVVEVTGGPYEFGAPR